ncbi:Cation transport ATPase, E1-E2 family [gamma proteobacterium HdN1]|nr:Cation transport ATPase, E1-E2 family [gamma proteobacterium HdN1]
MNEHCFHCGLPCPKNAPWQVNIAGIARPMCCPGCQAVAQTIVDMGMSSYYQHREQCEPGSIPSADMVPAFLGELDRWDTPALAQQYITTNDHGDSSTTLILSGITCAACAWLIEKKVATVDGVMDFRLNMASHRAVVAWNPQTLPLSAIIRAIAEVGYKAEPYQPERSEQVRKQENRTALIRIGVAGLGAMQVMMMSVGLYAGNATGIEPAYELFLRWVCALITLPVLFYAGYPFLHGAWVGLKTRHLGMDTPVSIALLLAYFASLYSTWVNGPEVYFDSVGMFVFFLLTGRYLEMRARHHAATTSLAGGGHRSLTARKLDDAGNVHLIPADMVAVGDRIQVRAGETIPCDGLILEGTTSINEAMLTGESLPVPRQRGEGVISGSINIDHPIQIEVTRPAHASTMNTLRRLLDQAQSEKPAMILLADRIAGKVVARVLVATLVTYFAWLYYAPEHAFWTALSVLIITCPCAIGLAVPTALTTATTALADLGFLITRGHTLEGLEGAQHVVFDKTGTLTKGQFSVAAIKPLEGHSKEECLALAQALESHSEHPIARAFSHLGAAIYDVQDIKIIANQGVQGSYQGQNYRIGTAQFVCNGFRNAHASNPPLTPPSDGHWLLLGNEQSALCWFQVADELREDAAALISDLHQRGIEVHLLSGDHSNHVQQVAQTLGIRHVHGGQSPADKLAFVQQLQTTGKVLMVGDGLNDAPVLAAASVSVAMASGSDLAKVSADALILNQHLATLQYALQVAVFNRRIMRQNIAWAVVYNTLAVPFAALGFVPPWLAAIGMSTSSLIVVTNALRTRRYARRLTA